MTAEGPSSTHGSPLARLGTSLFSFTGILAVGTGIGMVLAVVRIAVLTRLLDISVYGELTLLVIAASFLTIFCRISVVTGTLLTAFRGGDEDEGVADDEGPETGEHDPRKVLGTGLVSVLGMTAVLAVAALVFYAPIDEMLIGSGSQFPILSMALLGGLDATFHLAATISRFERRPKAFVLLQLANAALGISVAAIFIELGHGLDGAIGGLALGTLIALALALWVSRHRFALGFHRGTLMMLSRRGSPFIFITLGMWLFRHTDIFMVSRYLPEADVALYRAAARVAAMTSALIGAVVMARGPLLMGPMRDELRQEDLLVRADSNIVIYVVQLSAWLLVGLTLTRDLLIKVAPPDYASAAGLIPLLGVAALSTSALIVIYRTSKMPAKRAYYIAILLLMSPVLVVSSIALIPRLGLEGAALASIITPVASMAILLSLSQWKSDQPLDLPWARLAWTLLVGAAYVGAVSALMAELALSATLVSVVATLAFPLALVASRSLPPEEARRLISILPTSRGTS